MPDRIVLMTTVRFLHDLATAAWIGGMIAMAVAVLPAAKGLFGVGPQAQRLQLAVQKRLRVPVYISIVVLIVTGLLMSRRSPRYAGLLSWANPYSAALAWKHVLVAAMIVIALVRSLAFGRMPAQAAGAGGAAGAGAMGGGAGQPVQPGQPAALGARQKASMALLFLNVLLGIAVLLLSALSAALRAGPPA